MVMNQLGIFIRYVFPQNPIHQPAGSRVFKTFSFLFSDFLTRNFDCFVYVLPFFSSFLSLFHKWTVNEREIFPKLYV